MIPLKYPGSPFMEQELGRIPEELLVDPVYRHLHRNPRSDAFLEKFGLAEFIETHSDW